MTGAITRRDWILAAACWAEVLRADTNTAGYVYFNEAAAGEIEAMAGRIIPEDETPGAINSGVIRFIDQALAGYDQSKQPIYKRGLADTAKLRASMFPGSKSIRALNADQQNALLKAMEQTEFFQTVRMHTVLGFFGQPMGRKLMRTESMTYQPPFGFYDSANPREEAAE